MALDLHTISMMTGSNNNRQDRLLMGLLSSVATLASAVSVTVLGAITAGSGFTNINTVTLAPSGGTGSGLAAIPTSLKAVTVSAVPAPGTGYAINDTITLAGGTLQPGGPGTATVLTVSAAQLVGLAINNGGTGGVHPYVVGDTITLAGGTSSTAAIITVDAVDGSGLITAFHISTKGVYSAEASTFTQASTTSAAGTGATFKTAVWGVQAATISTAGAYSATPANAAAQASTSGTGTGATFTMLYGLGSAQITNSGNYTVAPSMTVTDSGAGTGASIATVTLGGNGNPIYVPITFDLPSVYNVQVEPSMNCQTYVPYASKTNSGFTVALVPPTTGSTLAAGTIDVTVTA